MAFDQNTDYAEIMNEQQAILDSTKPGTTEYQNAMTAYKAAQDSRNEKVNAMNESGTNTKNYTTTSNYTDTNSNGGRGPDTGTGKGSTTVTNAGSGDNAAKAKQLADQMNANSLRWTGATAETQAELEKQNRELAAQIQALGGTASFNSEAGTWTVSLPIRMGSHRLHQTAFQMG